MTSPLDWEQLYQRGSDESMWTLPGPSPELEAWLDEHPTAGGRALDLGCGTGRDCLLLARRGWDVTGIDISERAIEQTLAHFEREGLHGDFRVGDVLELPFTDSSFVLVLDRGCLHHITLDQRARYVQEVARVTRCGARLLIRGSATSRLPFTALTDATWASFSPQFATEQIQPMSLTSRFGELDGVCCELRRMGQCDD